MAEKIVKVTKAERYAEIKAILMEQGSDAELIEFIDAQVEALAKKAEKAKERAAQKAAEGDELRATIEGLMTSEWQSADAIVAAIGDEDITKGKVVARVSQLVKLGTVEKAEQKIGEKRVMCYKLAEKAEDAE